MLLQKLSLVWGVRAFFTDLNDQISEVYNESIQILKSRNLVEKGDTLVHVASLPLNQPGNANMIKVTLV